jgi:hypothetical protein
MMTCAICAPLEWHANLMCGLLVVVCPLLRASKFEPSFLDSARNFPQETNPSTAWLLVWSYVILT